MSAYIPSYVRVLKIVSAKNIQSLLRMFHLKPLCKPQSKSKRANKYFSLDHWVPRQLKTIWYSHLVCCGMHWACFQERLRIWEGDHAPSMVSSSEAPNLNVFCSRCLYISAHKTAINIIFTTRKVMFLHTPVCPGGSLSGGSRSRKVSVQGGSLSSGFSVQGVSVQGGLCPGGSLSRGVSVQGGFCPGVSVQGVFV